MAPPETLPLPEAVDRLLDQYDLTGRFPELPVVAPKDRFALQWLSGGLDPRGGVNPFPRKHQSFAEAQAVLRLVQGEQLPGTLPDLRESGSQLRVWRWGVRCIREGRWSPVDRVRWEEALLSQRTHPMLRGLALRHALCFALAEKNDVRFADLKTRYGEEAESLFLPFQTALALPGGLAPVLGLWSLSDLAPVQVPLGRPGLKRVIIQPLGSGGSPQVGAETLWIIPTREGSAPVDIERLDEASRREALEIQAKLGSPGEHVWLAPTREVLMKFGFIFFPVVIELDGQGRILKIRMGDAALAP